MAEAQQRAEICRTEKIEQLENQNREKDAQIRAMQDMFKDLKIKEQAATVEYQAAKIHDQVEIIRLLNENTRHKDEIIERDRVERERYLENERVLNELVAQLQERNVIGGVPQPNDPADTTFDAALRRLKKLYGQASENKIYVIGGVMIGIVGCALVVYGGIAVYSYLLTVGAKEVPQSYLSTAGAAYSYLLTVGAKEVPPSYLSTAGLCYLLGTFGISRGV